MASSINAITSSGGGVITTADSSGELNLQSDGTTVAAVSSTGVNVTGTINASGAITSTGQIAAIKTATAQSGSAGNVDFSGIPSWVKRITIMVHNASSTISFRVGTSGGIVSTGYTSTSAGVLTGNQTSRATSTTSFITQSAIQGVFTLNNISGNNWIFSGLGDGDSRNSLAYGYISLANPLTTVQVLGTFTAGIVNISYE